MCVGDVCGEHRRIGLQSDRPFSPSGKQAEEKTEGNTNVYRILCLVLAVFCLILLMAIIFLSIKRECLQLWF